MPTPSRESDHCGMCTYDAVLVPRRHQPYHGTWGGGGCQHSYYKPGSSPGISCRGFGSNWIVTSAVWVGGRVNPDEMRAGRDCLGHGKGPRISRGGGKGGPLTTSYLV